MVSARSDLPAPARHKTRGNVRPSKRSRRRAAVLVAVHLAILAHVAHWKITGESLSPLEPSEAALTFELGYVNAGLILLAVALLATLVLGRFFCGWACHVVAYQDLCAWLLGKVGLRPSPVRSRLLVWVPVLAAAEIFVLPALLRWLRSEPFQELSWHLRTQSFWERFPGPGIAAATLLVDGFLLVYLLGAKGFCTYGCPYGALFGAVDRFARGRIRVTSACEGCGHCTATCTSNVRVHEEVARYGMVVDPGCMKCMDCVDVCPKDALYFGFGPTRSSAVARAKSKPKRQYDFHLGEEIAMAVAFLVALYAFRNLYETVPFLLAIGLAVLAAIALIVVFRLARRPELHFQGRALKTPAGWKRSGLVAAVLACGFLGLSAHSAFVQYSARQGEGLLEHASLAAIGSRERAEEVARSRRHLERAERWGLVVPADLENQLASIAMEEGRFEEAEARLERCVELRPAWISPRIRLADLAMRRGDRELALTRLLAVADIAPDNVDAAQRLMRFLQAEPDRVDARLALVAHLIARGDLDSARNGLAPLLPPAVASPHPRAEELLRRIEAEPEE